MKKSSYQKLKQQNIQLKKDIKTLLKDPNSIEAMSIRLQHIIEESIIENLKLPQNIGDGFYKHITKTPNLRHD